MNERKEQKETGTSTISEKNAANVHPVPAP
jgi:hypothetical protein